MFARLRAFLFKLPVLILLGITAAYFLFGYFAFGPLVKWGAEKYIADKTGHRLTLDPPEFDPLALSVKLHNLKLLEPGGAPLLSFNELFVDFEAKSLINWAYTFADIRLNQPNARVELKQDGSLNWMPFIEALKDKEDKTDKPLPRLLIRHVAMGNGAVEFIDHKVSGGFESGISPITFQLNDLSTLPDNKGAYTLSTRTEIGAQVRWKGELGLNPVLATGELALDDLFLDKVWPYVRGKLRMAPPQGKAALNLVYRVGYADKELSLDLDHLGAKVSDLALKGVDDAQPSLTLGLLDVHDASFSLEKRQLSLPGIQVKQGQVRLTRRGDGSINIQDWFPTVPAEKPPPAAAPKTEKAAVGKGKNSPRTTAKSPPWRVDLAGFDLDGLALNVTDESFVSPLKAEVANVKLGFKAGLEVGEGEPEAKVSDLALNLSNLKLTSGSLAQPLFTLGDISLDGGEANLVKREARLAKVGLDNGQMNVVRQAGDHIPVLDALALKPGGQPAAGPQAKKASGPGWKFGVDNVSLTGFGIDICDESTSPAVILNLQDIRAGVKGVSENLRQPLPVKLALRVKQGGGFEAIGKVTPSAASADLKLRLAGLALSPAQLYLASVANLALASGSVSSSGRLRYGKEISYTGGFSVDKLLINESATGERFLAWQQMATDDLKAGTDKLDIGLLKLDGLGGKLIINKDKSLNFTTIMKSAPTHDPGQQVLAKVTKAAAAKPESKPFSVEIDSVQLADGVLDFADLSLALPFGTRIHQLKGYINSISSAGGEAPAQLELEGLVDEYGLARAAGQVNLFDPTGYMDIKTIFKNVEMTRLTPYSATFAGRKIASGKLSLDLEYKIKQRQLEGENQIIMDKLTLGERVESPTAKNLPLDLAIAILQDADGKIDLGLPVSGSLDDPQFSYGRIIWKAIVNVLTKIVLAPFKALGSLLGSNAEKMETISFDVGSAALQPPEREKLKTLAQALAKRPGLALTVKGAYNSVADRVFLREDQLRRAVAAGMGAKQGQGAEPPPISTANPKVRQALETLYGERMGKETLAKLLSFHRQANPEKKEGMGKLFSKFAGMFKTKEEPAPAEEMEAMKGADLHEVMYRRLLEREQVPETTLVQLAERRAKAIVDELAGIGGVARDRISVEAVLKQEGESPSVNAKLGLGVAKRPVSDKLGPAESGVVVPVPAAGAVTP